jgi:hypothetical protein
MAAQNQRMNDVSTLRRLLRRGVQVSILGLAAFYIALQVRTGYAQIAAYSWGESLRILPIILAFAFLLAHFAWTGILLAYLARNCGIEANSWDGIRVAIISSLGRYLPGKIWAAAGKVYLLRQRGSILLLSYVVALEMSLALAAGLFISIPIIVFYLLPVRPSWALLALPTLAIPPIVCRTDWLALLLRGIRPGMHLAGLQRSKSWLAFAGYVFSWVLLGIGFAYLVSAVYPLPVKFFPQALASMSGGWIAGFLTLVSPGGLGVREGILLALTKTWLPLEIAAVVSLGARLWTTVGELIALGLVSTLSRIWRLDTRS